MLAELELLYPGRGREVQTEIERMLPARPAQADAVVPGLGPLLISYPWTLTRGSERGTIGLLREFLDALPAATFDTLHLLPFYPATSDFGFAPTSNVEVDPALGSWHSIRAAGRSKSLMADVIVHHTSASHPWFQAFVRGEAEHRATYIAVLDEADYAELTRKRANAVFTDFGRPDGTRVKVLTRYGPDQVDLNYAEPKVLLRMIGVMACLAREGVRVFRLDAVSFLWNKRGTDGAHLPEAAALVRIFRQVLARLRADAVVVAEVDIDNRLATYFDGAERGARLMGYSYAFLPVLLEACLKRDASGLVSFLERSVARLDGSAVIRFLSTHDGIFMCPYDPPIDGRTARALADLAVAAGGGARWSGDGNLYELNIPFRDLLRAMGPDGDALAACALALLVCLPGVPAIYLNTLLNIPGDAGAVRATGDARAVNRGTIGLAQVHRMLEDEDSALSRWLRIIGFRSEQNDFLLTADTEIAQPRPGVVRLTRRRGRRSVVLHVNFSASDHPIPAEGVVHSLNTKVAHGTCSLSSASFALACFETQAATAGTPERGEVIH